MDVVVVSRFDNEAQATAVDVLGLASSFVVYADNVTAASRNNFADTLKLTGLIHKLDAKRCASARLEETALDNSGENSNVDITARYYANNLFALDGKLVEHNCGN